MRPGLQEQIEIPEVTADDLRRMIEDAEIARERRISDAQYSFVEDVENIHQLAIESGLVDENGRYPWHEGYLE